MERMVRNKKTPFRKSEMRIEGFKGMDISSTFSQIDQRRFADAQNIILDDRKAVDKRGGFIDSGICVDDKIGGTEALDGAITGMFKYVGSSGVEMLISAGTKIYSYNFVDNATEIYDGLVAGTKVRGFNFQNNFNFIN